MGKAAEYNASHRCSRLKLETQSKLTEICKKNQTYDSVIDSLLEKRLENIERELNLDFNF